jgi:hypothetical protein
MSEKRKEKADGFLEDPSVYKVPEQPYTVQIKFKLEAGVRVDDEYRLSSAAKTDLSSIEAIIKKHKVKLERAFEETEETLAREAAEAKESGVELPDLSRSYLVRTKDKKTADAIAKDLAENELVEVAEVVPPAIPAGVVIATSTPSYVNSQGYLNPAPTGVDAAFAWTKPGGKGTGIKMIDIEGEWNFNHEDLLQNQGGLAGGTVPNDLDWRNHGTAVLGVVGGDENTYGVTGIAPQCHQRGCSIYNAVGNQESHVAIKKAADLLSKGDIILIELQRYDFIPIEYNIFDFDAIKYATTKGIIVVAAAGNGGKNLDDSVYQKKFDRKTRDSGAIFVGAGNPPAGTHGRNGWTYPNGYFEQYVDRARVGCSNYGKLIDAQGWGQEVTSCGYNDLQGGSDENKWYTNTFPHTSAASPQIVGVIACLQGIRKAKGEPPLTFTELRKVLRDTGSPQQSASGRPSSQRIGNRPDLKAAYPYIWKNCFIATAAFGSEIDPEVQFLREFRDEIVLKSMFKTFFEGLLDQYYKLSPTIAKKMEENSLFKSFVKYSIVYPFVIGAKGVASWVRKAEKMFT